MAKQSKKRKSGTAKASEKKAKDREPNYFYVDDEAKQYEFSDFVRVSSFPHGMILYFGKYQPEEKKFGLFGSIVLPFDVAKSLSRLISDQIDQLKAEGLIVTEEGDK